MYAEIVIQNLDDVEKNAREILDHVEAIRELQRGSSWKNISVRIEVNGEGAASGN